MSCDTFKEYITADQLTEKQTQQSLYVKSRKEQERM
ncbi:hypothetical protein M7I_5278 [Glarea lozoyensis 74030]|uniref:Uncharacterized protein n=1 Tax=Glarea lozoyensis (strain ATCC 74030 / MF5533) TaxID=1104152 RepID=H0ERF9_GLAL7|nr:hypothetical protein M7I_5278 [Glarea lozoyensis 74030]